MRDAIACRYGPDQLETYYSFGLLRRTGLVQVSGYCMAVAVVVHIHLVTC